MQALADANAVGTGFVLVLGGMLILTVYFALQTMFLRRQLRRREEQSRRAQVTAYSDPLTELPNRRLFEDRLGHALVMAERRNASAAVMFIDLDDFKQVNDRYGRAFGDEVLAEFAVRCRERLRAGDTLARWGSDGFAVLIEDIADTSDIEPIVARLRDATARPFVVKGREIAVTVSIGVALGCNSGESPEELLSAADTAMYSARRTRPTKGFELFSRKTCLSPVAQSEGGQSSGPAANTFVRHPV